MKKLLMFLTIFLTFSLGIKSVHGASYGIWSYDYSNSVYAPFTQEYIEYLVERIDFRSGKSTYKRAIYFLTSPTTVQVFYFTAGNGTKTGFLPNWAVNNQSIKIQLMATGSSPYPSGTKYTYDMSTDSVDSGFSFQMYDNLSSYGNFTHPSTYFELNGKIGSANNYDVTYPILLYDTGSDISINSAFFNVSFDGKTDAVKFISLYDYIPLLQPEFDYTITTGSQYGKKLTLNFNRFNSTYTSILENQTTGEEFNIDPSTDFSYVVDNISYDSVFYLTIYKGSDIYLTRTIDVANEIESLNSNRFVKFNVINNESFSFIFMNTQNNDVCYIDFEDKKEVVDCGEQYVYSVKNGDITRNSFSLFTVENNSQVVYKKGYNINFFDDMPEIFLEYSYDNVNQYSVVNIVSKNIISTDTISYSYDNSTWSDLPNSRNNTLNIYAPTDFYVKIVRNGSIVATSYIYVNFNHYGNSSIEDQFTSSYGSDIFSYFRQITENLDFSILNNFSTLWNQLKSSSIYLYLLVLIVGSLCVFLIHVINRK